MNESKHPYQEYKESPIWDTIDKAINELVANNDLEENTHHEYIVGFIVQEVTKNLK